MSKTKTRSNDDTTISLQIKTKETVKGTVEVEFITTASTGSSMSDAVFAVEILPKSADTTAQLERFSHICSPAELIEFPLNIPGDNCYYRTNDIKLIFDTAINANLVIDHIKKDIQKLVKEYKALNSIDAVIETVAF